MKKTAVPSNWAIRSLLYQTVPSFIREDTVVANAMTKRVSKQDAKHFQNVMLVKWQSAETTHTSVWIALETQQNQECHG